MANRGGRLSAGQRQLVAFARAFLADPAVLILDEATSSLDVPSERLVQHALRTILAERTAIIIAHRLSTVEIADRVLVMEHGEIVEDGAPSDLIASVARAGSPTSTTPGSPRSPDGSAALLAANCGKGGVDTPYDGPPFPQSRARSGQLRSNSLPSGSSIAMA